MLGNMKVIVIPSIVGVLGIVPKNLDRKPDDQRENQTYPDHHTAKISLPTKKCPGDLRRLAVT